MDFITNTIAPYLFKGGLLSLATYFLGDIRRFVKSAMWQSIIQAIVLGFILFLLDRFMPSAPTLSAPTVSGPVATDGGLFGNQGILGNVAGQGFNPQGLLNKLSNLLGQNRQMGGNCGCGAKPAQVGGECAVSGASSTPVSCF